MMDWIGLVVFFICSIWVCFLLAGWDKDTSILKYPLFYLLMVGTIAGILIMAHSPGLENECKAVGGDYKFDHFSGKVPMYVCTEELR